MARKLNEPLLPGVPEINVATLFEPLGDEELRVWEEVDADDPLLDEISQ